MLTTDFDYNLPLELIAQYPLAPRDSSRLFVVDRKKIKENPSASFHSAQGKHFYDIIDYLKPGDLLVWNNSKVFKARLFGKLVEAENNQELLEHKKEIEIFLIREMENQGVWKVLAKPGRHLREGMRVVFAPSTSSGQTPDFYCDALVKENDGTILVQFPDNADIVRAKANKYGHIPVPPYVKDEPHELETYQTVYAKPEGSVAAPTAGFHFTDSLIEKLKNKGVEFAEVTLHVGLGTFLPVKSEKVEDHTMHSEWIELSEENAEKINRAKAEGRRVVAVGTTTVRTLEGIASLSLRGADIGDEAIPMVKDKTGGLSRPARAGLAMTLRPYHGDINIFIKPGFEFKIVDAMITNFHLPKSTLLMLVSAFAEATADKSAPGSGKEFMLECYRQAVKEKYRFFSFGDAMFIY
ncbi:MAG: S-adenosylmethionine:tRNA ribosyltransferase-isomerase [Candidatus Magasanikbacteria bacterium GW2011_GWC2_37_14]|uniref:S-adenosylmethionine:tRNA ribosyltransferase-isomerase n=1 Tax=Candidatus Magasanikbacteria bacterium GW2011_GWC2_37_14 TaxID=1619046 RepID=A0A0G0IU45_9BACT|nr:MAG: S-adenosylmethionine:tRNA ribosyltransferase-isomerase [Candidatus Magasanikbacteria bacterium GW2011_GWC2_37_14]